MGGYPIATASTPGFGYFRHPSGTFVACDCLRAWLPVLEDLAFALGLIDEHLRIIQLTGNAEASAGVHAQGGAFDLGQVSNAFTLLVRNMGAPYWPRFWTGNVHGHGVLNGCPHNDPARYQVAEYLRGEDGLSGSGRDTFPRPATLRTWTQGLAWAKGQIVAVTDRLDYLEAQNVAIAKKLDYVSLQVKVTAGLVAGNTDEIDQALADLKAQGLDDAGSSQVDLLSSKVDTLTGLVKDLAAAVDALPKADAPEPVPARGIDYSKYQTVEQIAPRLADPAVAFCLIAATTGNATVSPMLATHRANAHAAGKLVGLWHWLLPQQEDVVLEVEHFLGTVQPRVGELLAFDHEQLTIITNPDGTKTKVIPENAIPFLIDALEGLDVRSTATPLAYMSLWWVEHFHENATPEQWERVTRYPLWLAHWTEQPGVYGDTFGWRVAVHQWTKNDGGIDGDWTPDLEYLKSLAVKEVQ